MGCHRLDSEGLGFLRQSLNVARWLKAWEGYDDGFRIWSQCCWGTKENAGLGTISGRLIYSLTAHPYGYVLYTLNITDVYTRRVSFFLLLF